MLDAICYCLFNKPFRNINKPQLKNSINKKDCLVEAYFTSGKDKFLIRRGMNPVVFEIIRNDKLIDQSAASKDYQEVLEKYYVRMNYKTFKQVVMLGSASFIPFMQLTAAHRREVIEDLLDIQIFSLMNVLLKDKIFHNNNDIIAIDHKIQTSMEKIKLHDTHIQSITEDINKRKNSINSRIDRMKVDIDIEESIIADKNFKSNELSKEVTTYDAEYRKLIKMTSLRSQLENKISKLDKDKSFYIEHDNCPTCNQIIDELFKKTIVDSKVTQSEETMNAVLTISSQIADLDNSVKSMKGVKDKIQDLSYDIRIRQQKIESFKDQINDLQTELSEIKEKMGVHLDEDGISKVLERELGVFSTEKKLLMENKEIYRASALILKDNGIKSRIIKQYVPIINKLINKYLASMDFFVSFELDETFNETIKSRFRDEFSYESFSEGEKSKIDLALLFTWRHISRIRNSASTNILILDEVFDGSLDTYGSDELSKILIELSKDSNIIVISHKTDQLLDKFDKVIKFEKKKNFTKLIEVT
jgi:DNA repair exonuclease SbcCD ATPase subunit